MTKPTDTEIAKDAEQDVIEAVIADSAPAGSAGSSESNDKDATSAVETEAEPPRTFHSGRNFILMVLLIIAAVLGSLALSGKLKPLYQSLTAGFDQASVQQHEPEKKKAAVVKPAPAKATVKHPVVLPQVQQRPPVSSEEVATLLSGMHVLRDALGRMSEAQQSLQNGLQEQQQMNLQVRLRWIADPASRLPQLQLTWEEISLLPGLSDAQRSEAVRMHALARNRVQQLKQWQDALNKWADALVTPTHRNILPEPPYPWLAWIVSQFKLRQAPSVEAHHLTGLRDRLLNAARHLMLESWPEKGEWQSLQAELLLQIKAMRQDRGDENTAAVETGLPENFDAIQADINTLRRTAQQWQQGGGL